MSLVWIGSIFIGLVVLGTKRPQIRDLQRARRWAGIILIIAGMIGYATSPLSYLLALQIFGCVLTGYVVTYVSGVLTRPKHYNY